MELTVELCEEYQGLCHKLARKYWRSGLDVEDLTQEGILGLARALEDYDANIGPLTPYAWGWIEYYIQQAARSQAPGVPIPERERRRTRQDPGERRSTSQLDIDWVDHRTVGDLERVGLAMESLSPKQRYVLENMGEDRDYYQIARTRREDDWTWFTVKLISNSGRKALRAALDRQEI